MSGIGTGTALAIGMGTAAAGTVAGSALSANAAGDAASTQANAADYAAELQQQTAEQNLQYQGNLINAEITNQEPWYRGGEGALATLESLMGITPGPAASGVQVPSLNGTNANGQPMPGGYSNLSEASGLKPAAGATTAAGAPTGAAATNAPLLQGWNQTFQSPTSVTEQNDPGYQFRLQQGVKAMDMGAAASGNLLTGGTENAEQQYGQNYASNEYQNTYNRALENYDTNFNTFEANQTNQYNRLAAMAGLGQTTASQLDNSLTNSGAIVGNTMTNTANAIGNAEQNAAAATASGYIGGANAWSGSLNNLGSTYTNYALLSQLLNGGGAGTASSNVAYAGDIPNVATASWS
jgi:hypothetical protein